MSKKILHICVLVIVVISIFLFTCPSSLAVSDDLIFTSPMASPTTSDYCGYVNLLLRNKTDGTYRVRTIFWNSGYIVNNYTDLQGEYKVVPTICEVYVDHDELKLTFHFDGSGGFYSIGYIWAEPIQQYGSADFHSVAGFVDTWTYTNSGFDFVGIQSYGNVDTTYNLPNSMPQFSVLWNADAIQYEQANTIATLLELINYNYEHIEGIKLQQILYSFEDVCNYLDLMNNELYNISSGIWQVDWFLETDMFNAVSDITNTLYITNTKLQTIIDILNKTGSSSFEELPTDTVNDFSDKEDELLDKDTSSEKDALKVEIDTTASNTIWNIVEQFLSINPLIFGLFIAMLSLGVVSMILNR